MLHVWNIYRNIWGVILIPKENICNSGLQRSLIKIVIPGTLNNQFLMDVFLKQPFPCKDLVSSNWNNQQELAGSLKFQIHLWSRSTYVPGQDTTKFTIFMSAYQHSEKHVNIIKYPHHFAAPFQVDWYSQQLNSTPPKPPFLTPFLASSQGKKAKSKISTYINPWKFSISGPLHSISKSLRFQKASLEVGFFFGFQSHPLHKIETLSFNPLPHEHTLDS